MAMTNISETTEIISDERVTAYSERSRRIRGQPSITTDNNAIVLCNFSETFFTSLNILPIKLLAFLVTLKFIKSFVSLRGFA